MKFLKKFIFNNVFVILLLIIATILFFIVLNDKSPYYAADSYLYKHFYYQFKGYSYEEIRIKILSEIKLDGFDEASKNIILNEKAYKYSLSLISKRTFYPFVCYLISLAYFNDYISLLIPVFISYLGVLVLIYIFIKSNKSSFFAFIVCLLFLSFYPYVYWSTYFLNYTIGTLFWIFNIFVAFKYINKTQKYWLFFYILILVLSLTNRETNVLLLPFMIFIKIFSLFNTNLKKSKIQINNLLISTLLIITFFIINYIFKQKNIIDVFVSVHNNFGLDNQQVPLGQTFNFWVNSIIYVHQGLFNDFIKHKFWGGMLLITILSVIIRKSKKINLMEIVLLCSAISSYCGLLIFPILSYRYFFPIVMTLCYLCLDFIVFIFNKLLKIIKI